MFSMCIEQDIKEKQAQNSWRQIDDVTVPCFLRTGHAFGTVSSSRIMVNNKTIPTRVLQAYLLLSHYSPTIFVEFLVKWGSD